MIFITELTDEEKLKYELEVYKSAFDYAIQECTARNPFPIEYNHGDLEEPWNKDKWFVWFKDKAKYKINNIKGDK